MIFKLFLDLNNWFFLIENFNKFNLFFLSLIIYYFIILLEQKKIILNLIIILLLLRFGYFFSWNILYFFIFFELRVFPIIVITIFFGYQIEKISSIYFIIFYSFLGGLPFLILILLYLNYFKNNNFFYLFFKSDFFINFMFFLCFLIKFPIYFFHNWLPKIHVESSIVGRVLLAGLLLKFGTYGFVCLIEILNYSNFFCFYFFGLISLFYRIISIIIEIDIKSIIAFSSIIHISLLYLILLVNRNLGLLNSYVIIISHGFISILIFIIVSYIIYSSEHRIIISFKSFFYIDILGIVMDLIRIIINCNSPISLGSLVELNFFLLIIPNLMFFEFIMFLNFLIDFYRILFILVKLILLEEIKEKFNYLILCFFYYILLNINFILFFL